MVDASGVNWQGGLDGQDAGTPELLAQATLAQAATMVRALTRVLSCGLGAVAFIH